MPHLRLNVSVIYLNIIGLNIIIKRQKYTEQLGKIIQLYTVKKMLIWNSLALVGLK